MTKAISIIRYIAPLVTTIVVFILFWIVCMAFAIAWVGITKPLGIRREKKKAQNALGPYAKAYGHACPITVKTLAGDSYLLTDWGECADLKEQPVW